MSFTTPFPYRHNHQSGFITTYRRDRHRLWTYPSDLMIYRLQPSIIPHWPSDLYDDRRGVAEGGHIDHLLEKKANPGESIAIGQRGALERFTEMPIEILYEIFGYLHPMDVLNLSRTTRSLRSILLTRHAGGVWRSALGGVRALPSCPSDMTEPQYASLAFDDWCQLCLEPKTEVVSWLCRVRYCRDCIKSQFVTENELLFWIPEGVCIEKPDTIFPYITLETYASRRSDSDPLYFFPFVQKYVKELEIIARTGDKEALAKWCLEKKNMQCMRLTHAALFEYWNTHWAFRRSSKSLPSYVSEVALIVFLTMLLIYLWREKLVGVA